MNAAAVCERVADTTQLPAGDDTVDALDALTVDDPDQATFEMRWRVYVNLRTGFHRGVHAYLPHFVHDHDDAIRVVMTDFRCAHDMRTVSHYDHTDPVLGTWDRGVVQTCTKCGHEDLVSTSRSYWSGD